WHAIDQANTKCSSGYASTGVDGVVCSQHGLVRQNGFDDLQKGEQYANMDFILFQSLQVSCFATSCFPMTLSASILSIYSLA
ncbi:hypothetical protein BDN71DRAFT_1382482, partial [Pleurotus eryngii]